MTDGQLRLDELVGPSPETARDEGRAEHTPEQRAAVSSPARDVLLEAGAGTGKTRVLVERYCDAAAQCGIDAVLAFTFTERAAAELRHRVRRELGLRAASARRRADAERAEMLELMARDSERAWISTIHGFCRRLLGSHPVALGLDPRFRVLDAAEADRVATAAFDEALEELLAGADPQVAKLVAATRIADLRALVRTAHDELRSQGLATTLPEPRASDPRAALAELVRTARAACDETAGGRGGRANLERLARAAALDTAAALPSEAEIADLRLGSSAKAFSGPCCEAYRRAWRATAVALAEREAVAHYRHVARLARIFARRFAALKDERSGLDFEDLQLEACRLLRERPAIAASYRDRFAHVLVDEFQDTNRLQLELVRLVRGEQTSVFCVGDEFQAIYGFRHADVEVFRRERSRIAGLAGERGRVMRLSGNFRSHPQVVAAVNAVGDALLDGFNALTVGSGDADRAQAGGGDDPRVELLLTPAGPQWEDEALGIELPGDYPSGADRVAESRLLAGRLRTLVEDGRARRDEIVVLLRAYTHVSALESELERAGLRPYVVGGRGYWSSQQVDDVRRLLGTIANPLDDECLLGVLASPACAVLPDTLWLLRQAAGRGRHLWPVLEARFGTAPRPQAEPADEEAERRDRHLDAIPPGDAQRLAELCARLAELRQEAPLTPLDALIERAIAATGYDLAVLGMDQGRRRHANVRKLMRMARDFEAAEGRDLRGLLDFLAERAGSDREGEAATEAEGHDGVRVMTVHAAKGLEFPVVAVADLGRGLLDGSRPPAVKVGRAEEEGKRADQDDAGGPAAEPSPPRIGIRLARFGARAVGVFGYDELLERAGEDQAAEACRLAYVAATRARDRLILSGRFDAARLERAGADGAAPGTPVSERLMLALGLTAGDDRELTVPAPGARPGLDARFGEGRIGVRFNRPQELGRLRAAGRPRPAARTADSQAPPIVRIAGVPEPASRHLSYSALATYARCGYRFFAERVVGLAPDERSRGGADGDSPARSRFGFGNAVHAMLEWSARRDWRQPGAELCAELLRRQQLEPSEERLERARAMVSGWLGSALRAEIASSGAPVRAELPFLLPLGGSAVRGTIDLRAGAAGAPLVVDYKTDSVGPGGLAALADRYSVQRAIYALATVGEAERVRTAYVFLERPDEPVEATLEAGELERSRAELERAIAGIREGRFAVTDNPHRALCHDCPARRHLCSHPSEMTGRSLA